MPQWFGHTSGKGGLTERCGQTSRVGRGERVQTEQGHSQHSVAQRRGDRERQRPEAAALHITVLVSLASTPHPCFLVSCVLTRCTGTLRKQVAD